MDVRYRLPYERRPQDGLPATQVLYPRAVIAAVREYPDGEEGGCVVVWNGSQTFNIYRVHEGGRWENTDAFMCDPVHGVRDAEVLAREWLAQEEGGGIGLCLLCADPVDYCTGHGEWAARVVQMHEEGQHERCNSFACADAPSQRDRVLQAEGLA